MQNEENEVASCIVGKGDATSSVPDILTVEPSHFINPPRYFSFQDATHGGFRYTGLVVRVKEDDNVAVTFVAEQLSKFYTHTRNRATWTGPKLDLEFLDEFGFPVGATWRVVQVNRICTQRASRHLKETTVPGAFDLLSDVKPRFSSYRMWGC